MLTVFASIVITFVSMNIKRQGTGDKIYKLTDVCCLELYVLGSKTGDCLL